MVFGNYGSLRTKGMVGRSPKDFLEFVQPSVFGMMEPNGAMW